MNSLYWNFRNKKFTDIYDTVDKFINDYKSIGIPTTISESNASTLYYLLYAKYGNSTIASSDENRFKASLFSIVFADGPVWEKKLEIQGKLRALTDDEIFEGSRQIYNNAANPSTDPDVMTDDELDYINSQSVTKNKRGRLEAYGLLNDMLDENFTSAFIKKFNILFIKIVMPEFPLWYVMNEDEDEGV